MFDLWGHRFKKTKRAFNIFVWWCGAVKLCTHLWAEYADFLHAGLICVEGHQKLFCFISKSKYQILHLFFFQINSINYLFKLIIISLLFRCFFLKPNIHLKTWKLIPILTFQLNFALFGLIGHLRWPLNGWIEDLDDRNWWHQKILF